MDAHARRPVLVRVAPRHKLRHRRPLAGLLRHLELEYVHCPSPRAGSDRAAGGGNAGDVRPVGEGVSELRIDYGPGYRVYIKRQDSSVVMLLAGGDKRTQSDDIEMALRLARNL